MLETSRRFVVLATKVDEDGRRSDLEIKTSVFEQAMRNVGSLSRDGWTTTIVDSANTEELERQRRMI